MTNQMGMNFDVFWIKITIYNFVLYQKLIFFLFLWVLLIQLIFI